MKNEREPEKTYKVVFGNDDSNYEEFETLEKAENFSARYLNCKVVVNQEGVNSNNAQFIANFVNDIDDKNSHLKQTIN